MAWDGNGNFSRTNGFNTGSTAWQLDRNASVNIVASRHDTHDQDLATGINNCLTKDGQNTPTANLPMGGLRHTNVSDGAARNQYASVAQMQDQGPVWGGTSTGAANTYAFNTTPAITAYTAGQAFRFVSHQANTGAVTININSLGSKAITKEGATPLVAGDIPSGMVMQVIYDGTQFQLFGHIPYSVSATVLASTGDVKATAVSTAPTGWLFCAGQAVSRTTFAALFAAIGTTYGAGDGSTTFNVPDLRGRVIAGVDNMNGSAANRITVGVSGITGTTLGAAGGNENMQSHTHSITDPGHAHTFNGGTTAGNRLRSDTQGTNGPQVTTDTATTGITINTAGSGSSQNVQPTIMLNWIIKT